MNTQEIKITNAQTISINAKMQDKVVTPSLEQQTILPDENYNSLSKVVVNAVTLENKIVHPNRDTQIITPTESLGLSSVTVEPVSLEEKSIVPTKEVQVLNPSNEYVGFSQVTVEKIPEDYIIPEGNLDIRNNGNYDVINNATVNVNVQPNLQEKEARVTAPTNIFVHPDEEYDGLSFVNVIASVDTETKEVTPTKELQTINRSDGKYIDSVTVNVIPDEYIIPSGEMEITENGSYDVTDKASVNVDVKANLGTKTITENGVYNASDDNLEGYSSVEVATSGADLSEYFNGNPETFASSSSSSFCIKNYFKKLPDLTIPDNVSSINYLFGSSNTGNTYNLSLVPKVIFNNNVNNLNQAFSELSNVETIDVSSCNVENVSIMTNTFRNDKKLTRLDLSTWNPLKLSNAKNMFYSCVKLMFIDMRDFDFTKLTIYTEMFGSDTTSSFAVPNDCEIIVKDEEQKAWLATNFSRMTNVKTVAELGE